MQYEIELKKYTSCSIDPISWLIILVCIGLFSAEQDSCDDDSISPSWFGPNSELRSQLGETTVDPNNQKYPSTLGRPLPTASLLPSEIVKRKVTKKMPDYSHRDSSQ